MASCATIRPQINKTIESGKNTLKSKENVIITNANPNYYFDAPFSEKWQVCCLMDEIVDGSSRNDTAWVNESIYPMNPIPVFEAAGKLGYMIFIDLGVSGKIEIRNYQYLTIFKKHFDNCTLNPVLWEGVMTIVNDANK